MRDEGKVSNGEHFLKRCDNEIVGMTSRDAAGKTDVEPLHKAFWVLSEQCVTSWWTRNESATFIYDSFEHIARTDALRARLGECFATVGAHGYRMSKSINLVSGLHTAT